MIRRGLARLWYWGAVLNRLTGWRASRLNRFLYRASRGRVGGWVPGAPVILLTTKGRRSGRFVTVPLAGLRDGNDLIVGAGAGGSPTDPQWYLNLLAEPTGVVQLRGETFSVKARLLRDGERERVVRELVSPVPLLDLHHRRTPREIPIVRLTRI